MLSLSADSACVCYQVARRYLRLQTVAMLFVLHRMDPGFVGMAIEEKLCEPRVSSLPHSSA
jgi:hypothetical protein